VRVADVRGAPVEEDEFGVAPRLKTQTQAKNSGN
jgi:hypothetical protein